MYQFSLIKQTKLMGMGDNTVVASNKHKFMKIFYTQLLYNFLHTIKPAAQQLAINFSAY